MLSATAINNAKPKDKTYKKADEKGLYISITPTGSKLWRLDYRYLGKRKTLALGAYPDVSLAQAREKRDNARKLLASDPPIDPSEYRKTQKLTMQFNSENSFEAVAREWWQSHMAKKAESHKEKVIRRFEIYLFPFIGKRPIADIAAPELLSALKRIESVNKLDTAHRALQTSGQVFRYAIQTGRAERNIAADLKGALPARSVKHMATLTEPKEVAELLRAINGFNGTLTVQCALKLAPLIFARPGELRHARWSEINFEEKEWRYFVGKKKANHLVPLSNQAIEILKTMHQISGHREYVFPGGHSPLRPMSEAAVNAALKRMGYDTQTEITGHGFRAMARTLLHERLGIDPHAIEHQLSHKVPDTLGEAYNRTRFIEQRREMMQIWADYLDELKA